MADKEKNRKAIADSRDNVNCKYDEMIEVLRENFKAVIGLLEQNNRLMNKYFHSAPKNAQQESGPVKQLICSKMVHKSTNINVYIKCNFLRIIRIDTANEEYEAEVFILARWEDEDFKYLTGDPEELFDESIHWRPHLVIRNCDQELKKEAVTFSVDKNAPGHIMPVVTMGWRFQGIMKETLELENYPVDVQDLSIELTTKITLKHIQLLEDQQNLSSVNIESFPQAQEWRLYHHVQFVPGYWTQEYENISKHPMLTIKCHVARSLGYFIWNVIVIMFLIVCIAFTNFAIEPNDSTRLAINITLLLTGVTYKLVVTQSLPRISYLTHLDVYVLAALIFLGCHAIQNSILMYLTFKYKSRKKLLQIDIISIAVLLLLLFLFHLIFGFKLYILSSKKRRKMKKIDRLYMAKMKESGKFDASGTSIRI